MEFAEALLLALVKFALDDMDYADAYEMSFEYRF